MKTRLILADGKKFVGESLGRVGESIGEVVFNTAMSGYQEILTDPSYHGQIITMTSSQIGNYGVNKDDYESRKIFASGFIVREYSPLVSHWQATESLDSYLKKYDVVGISEIDTRALTRHIRDYGAQMGVITNANESDEILLNKLRDYPTLVARDIVANVTTDKIYDWPMNGTLAKGTGQKSFKVAVMDFGVKYSILRNLQHYGCTLKVFPATSPPEDILAWKPEGVFLSNGPGDPEPLETAVKTVRALLVKLPIFGICLGHQIIGLALGGKTVKMKFGHHGANHPVKNLKNGLIEITSQNHGFVVDGKGLRDSEIDVTHVNLNDDTLEGIALKNIPVFSVQYHPESAPGPHDSTYLFGNFIKLMKDFNA